MKTRLKLGLAPRMTRRIANRDEIKCHADPMFIYQFTRCLTITHCVYVNCMFGVGLGSQQFRVECACSIRFKSPFREEFNDLGLGAYKNVKSCFH